MATKLSKDKTMKIISNPIRVRHRTLHAFCLGLQLGVLSFDAGFFRQINVFLKKIQKVVPIFKFYQNSNVLPFQRRPAITVQPTGVVG
jgi:hypothetical protein